MTAAEVPAAHQQVAAKGALEPAALLRHATAALGLLVGLTFWVGTAGYFIIDEAALYGQLDVLEQGSWTLPLPTTESGAPEEHVPMARSDVTDDGWAPFAKHPVHVALARTADSIAGHFGVRMLSVLGTVAAAAAAAMLCRGRTPALVAFWLTAALSPLAFYSQLVLAHTLGAAVAGLLAVVTVVRRPSARTAAAAFGLTCIGGLLRSEFLLLGFAFAGVLMLATFRGRRGGWGYGTALACAGGSLGAWLLEPRILRALIGGDATVAARPTGAGDGVFELTSGAARSLFDLTLDSDGLLQPLSLVLAIVLALVALAVVRLRPEGDVGVVVLAVVSVASAAVHLLEPHVIRGFVFAFPPVLVMVVVRRKDTSAELSQLVAVAGVFAVAVFATQYRLGGGPEWGWRYFIIGVPLLTPPLAVAVVNLWRRGAAPSRVGVVGVLLTSALILVGGLAAQRQTVLHTATFLERSEQIVRDSGVGHVVAANSSFGRFTYRLSTEGLVATIDRTNSRGYLTALADRTSEPVLLVWAGSGPPPDLPLGPYRLTDRTYDLAGVYSGVELEAH